MILAYEENKYIWMESLIVVLIIVLYHKEEIYFIKNIFTKKKYVMEKEKVEKIDKILKDVVYSML